MAWAAKIFGQRGVQVEVPPSCLEHRIVSDEGAREVAGEPSMFQSWSSFLFFREKKSHEERYFHSEKVQEFLNAVLDTGRERFELIPEGQRYWRAQLGSDLWPLDDGDGQVVDYRPVPYPAKRMKPLPEKASEGRVNPRGMACLYLATDEKTAISEVRPWVGSYVTVAEFETRKPLKVVDCSRCEIDPVVGTVRDVDMLFRLKPPSPEETTEIVWRWIDLAFSQPVDRDDSTADYVPTQIIAELFKTNGFDGIKYKSVFNGGKNLALFDLGSAEQIGEGKVVQVTKIELDFQQIHPFPSRVTRS
jgi:sarcosine oxidase delta subunit